MIFHKHRTIFFHPGKTAGTAIEHMLRPAPMDPLLPNRDEMYGLDPELKIYLHHATCQTTLDVVGEEVFWSYFKFAIVRNPYTRVLSAYHYLVEQNQRLYGSFRDYVMRLPRMIEEPRRQLGSHQIAQIHYTHINGDQVADFVGRFEQLDDAIERLSAELGRKLSLPRVNVGRAAYRALDKREAYDDEMVDVIRDVYREDFTLYGYHPDPPGDA